MPLSCVFSQEELAPFVLHNTRKLKKLTQRTIDTSKLHSVQFFENLFSIKSVLWSIFCLITVTVWQTRFELSRVKIQRKWPEGKLKWIQFELAGGSSYWGFEFNTEGKILGNVWSKSTGNQFWSELQVSASFGFELLGVNHKFIQDLPQILSDHIYLSSRNCKRGRKDCSTLSTHICVFVCYHYQV